MDRITVTASGPGSDTPEGRAAVAALRAEIAAMADAITPMPQALMVVPRRNRAGRRADAARARSGRGPF